MHDGHIALTLIHESVEFDLNLMPARLAPDQQSDIGLEIVAGRWKIGQGASGSMTTTS